MDKTFQPVWHHRMKYFLSPQLDLYKNISKQFLDRRMTWDYGCGTGFGTIQLSDHQPLVGIDSDPEAIEFAQSVLGNCAQFQVGNLAYPWDSDIKGPLPSLITCIEVVEHCCDPYKLLNRLVRSLNENGTIVVSTKNRDSGYRKNKAHETEFTLESFRDLIFSTCSKDARFTDFTLQNELESHVTPMVAIWQKS